MVSIGFLGRGRECGLLGVGLASLSDGREEEGQDVGVVRVWTQDLRGRFMNADSFLNILADWSEKLRCLGALNRLGLTCCAVAGLRK